MLSAAALDPQGFVRSLPQRIVIDEVQRAPELLLAIKLAVDEDRAPGRFLLTGSADVLSLPRVADSLAGRVEVLHLWPLSEDEVRGSRSDFVAALFGVALSFISGRTRCPSGTSSGRCR